jgi:archaellum biogenesis ATPase FlaH
MSDGIIKGLKAESVDIEKICDEASAQLTEAKSGGNRTDILTHIGSKNNGSKIVDQILSDKAQTFIPTGFNAFDKINRGVMHGALWMLAATTGSGKTAMSMQIARNMAEYGAKVCIVSLEMDERELMMRRLANLTQISMKKFINPSLLSNKERRKVKPAYREYRLKLKKRGAIETWLVPDEDISIEEVVFLLKPYGYDLIIVDYLGLLKGMDGDDQWKRLSSAARFSKRYATINKTIICLCAQLGEDMVIRYSRGMKEHASLMWTWNFDAQSGEKIAIVDQQKARNQVAFKFPIHIEFDTMTMRDLTEDEEEEYELEQDNRSEHKKGEGKKKTKGFKDRKKSTEKDYYNV